MNMDELFKEFLAGRLPLGLCRKDFEKLEHYMIYFKLHHIAYLQTAVKGADNLDDRMCKHVQLLDAQYELLEYFEILGTGRGLNLAEIYRIPFHKVKDCNRNGCLTCCEIPCYINDDNRINVIEL